MEGESVSFDCVAKGEKSVVSWFREGVEITEIEVTEVVDFTLSIAQALRLRDTFRGRISRGERPSARMER